MAFEIPEDLNRSLMGVAWMIGTWKGSGKSTWPGEDETDFAQQIDFSTNGGPYLHYLSQTWYVDESGAITEPHTIESGFWLPKDDGSVEVVLSSPEGWSEIWAGSISGAKIELVTDVVARTQSAELEYTGGQRLYGNVEGDLLWTFDRATTDHPLQSYMWGRLQRA